MRSFGFVLALLVFLVADTACRRSGGMGEGARLKVVVSIYPLYDMVRRIAGPDADVTLVVPPGRTEHGFSPGPKEKEAFQGARFAVAVGLGLDPWMDQVVAEIAPKARMLKAGDRVPLLAAKDGAEGEESDPHVWLDPARMRLIVRAIVEDLGRIDAAHVLAYRARATELDRALAALDADLERRTAPLKGKALITHHRSFQYFAERYGLEIVGVVTPAPGAPVSPDHGKRLAEALPKARAIFSEPQLDVAPAKTLAAQAHLPLGVLDPLGGGPETDSYEKTLMFDVTQLDAQLRAP